MSTFTESTVEETAHDWFKGLGYTLLFAGDLAPEEPAAERTECWVALAGCVYARRGGSRLRAKAFGITRTISGKEPVH
jgi:hypothetical protein